MIRRSILSRARPTLLLVLVAAAFVYLVVKQPGGFGQATAFFLLPALKQYVVVPTVLYMVMKPPRASARAVLFGLTIASLTVVPFLAWDWRSTGAERLVSRNAISCSYRSGASIRPREAWVH